MEEKQDDQECEIGERLGPQRSKSREDHGNAVGGDQQRREQPEPGAGGAMEMADEQRRESQTEREFDGDQAGRAGGAERHRHDRFAEPLVVDPGRAGGQIRVGVRADDLAGVEQVEAEADVAPEVGIGVSGREQI
jgi:hypothetical protein